MNLFSTERSVSACWCSVGAVSVLLLAVIINNSNHFTLKTKSVALFYILRTLSILQISYIFFVCKDLTKKGYLKLVLKHFLFSLLAQTLQKLLSGLPPSAMSDCDDDDVPTLSSHALAALQEFYKETGTGPDRGTTPSDPFTVGAVEEDWVRFLGCRTPSLYYYSILSDLSCIL